MLMEVEGCPQMIDSEDMTPTRSDDTWDPYKQSCQMQLGKHDQVKTLDKVLDKMKKNSGKDISYPTRFSSS